MNQLAVKLGDSVISGSRTVGGKMDVFQSENGLVRATGFEPATLCSQSRCQAVQTLAHQQAYITDLTRDSGANPSILNGLNSAHDCSKMRAKEGVAGGKIGVRQGYFFESESSREAALQLCFILTNKAEIQKAAVLWSGVRRG